MRVLAPAKINLFLRIIGRRADGYHLLDSLIIPVSLYDEITIDVRKDGSGITITCDDPTLPCDETNLAYKAAALLCREAGVHARVVIDLRKNIPAGAGLGGGSSDAAAVLKSLNTILCLRLSEAELAALAIRLGADVPFFIPCRPARIGGIGEVLTPVPSLPTFPIVIVVPPFSIATPWAYRCFDELPSSESSAVGELTAGHWPFPEVLINDLERAVLPQYPQIAQLKNYLLRLGATGALMSGSGSSVFGVFQARAAAEQAMITLRNAGKTFLVEPLPAIPLTY